MKRKCTILLAAMLIALMTPLWGQQRTVSVIDFSEQGYENGQDVNGEVIDIDANVSVVFNKADGGTAPAYYSTGTSIRAYAGNTVEFSAASGVISSIVITPGSGDKTNEVTADVGDLEYPVWTGSSGSVVLTIQGTSGHRRIKAIEVTYDDGGTVVESVSTPTFSPAGGTYYEAQTVSIQCATAGASIYYTLDGGTPTTGSLLYSGPFTVNETTTVKAIGVKDGFQNSAVATTTYTIQEPTTTTAITIAEARALALNEYAQVEGVVTFIDGKNVYIQDATAGIDLFLTSNVPSTLALGDMVSAYGKRADYKGLVELSGINPSDASQFSVLSSGHELPLAVKTIAEILSDHENGTDALQSTRVQIVDATVGTINFSNNTTIIQDDQTLNIYKMPAVDGLASGDVITVTGVVGCFNAPQLRVNSTDDVIVQSTPTLSVATPVFNPEGGSFTAPVTVSISCATEGATIHYTLNGTSPTASSPVYSTPFTISTTTTVKAMAVKEGMNDSEVAEATYSLPTVLTIAEARALNNGEFALVEGVVTFIDGRNIYAQDATAGIVLYLNSNTVPSTLAIGDQVRAYGKKAVYKGLVELSDINGGDEACFQVLSSGNTLPLAVKTVEECLIGGADLLQSTRVMIQDAVIGDINTSGNTVLTQGGQSINIYRIPALTDIEANSHVNVTAVIGYFNAPQLRVASAADVLALNANLFVTPMSLQGFTYEQGEGPSVPQSFTVSGQYLAPDVTVSAVQYFELSLTPQGTYTASLNLTTTGGVLEETTLYVRMVADLTMDNYTSNVTVTSGEDEVSLSLSGAVTMSNMVSTPVLSLASGAYMTPQTVSITCETEGAVIHYTTDGTDPTESSPVYTAPIAVDQSMTIKAIGMRLNWMNSYVASATYEILTPITIAEARQLANNQYATVEGIVTMIDNRNVYVQDKTAGIVLYLNNNTIPANLAVGDRVRSYGKKTVYSGLVELSGINGNNENVFMILSSGNTLPLKNKTIAQLQADYQGDNMLQSTRVRIVNATIRSINPNGNSQITQGDAQINIYKMPVVDGLVVGDFVTVTGVVGCFNAPQLLVRNSEDVTYTHRPTIAVTPNALSGFEYVVGQGPSAEQTLSVNGTNLSGNIRVAASEHYEISLASGTQFMPAEAIVFFPVDGEVNAATVYVRLKEGLALGQYNNESISVTSEGADEVVATCSGSVHEQGTPGDNDWRRIHSISELAEGNRIIIAARYDNENTNCYYAMTASTSGKPEGVFFTSTTSGADEVLPSEISGNAETFAWTLGIVGDKYTFTNTGGSVLGYSSSTNFATGGDNIAWSINEGVSIDTGVMVSNYAGFNIINGNVTNRAAALNTNHNFGPYSTSNMTNGNGANYNFYLDIFVNSTSVTPTVSAPVFSPEAGVYYEAQEVSLQCATEGAVIYFSNVSEEGPWTAYEAPILVASDMTLWAYAEKDDYNPSAVVSAEYVIRDNMVILFDQDWEGDWNGWTEVSVYGEPQWTIGSYSGNHYAYANAYNQGATEDWLISPAFDLDANPGAVLSFRTARNYNGPNIEVYFSNDYDGQNPTNATWQPIACALSQGSWNWVETGELSLDAFSGSNCYIGYRYTSTEDAAAGWEVDDITLYSGGSSNDPYLVATPNALSGFSHIVGEGPSGAQTFELSGGYFLPLPGGGYGSVYLTLGDNDFEMSLDGEEYHHILSIELDETLQLEPTTIYVRLNGDEIGQYSTVINIEEPSGVSIEVALSGEVLSADQPFIEEFMPMYIQGNNGSNNNRVPVAIAVYIENLEPNTTYRYVNQLVDDNDGPETAGAGNVIYANPDGFYRTTSPSLSSEGGYGEFTTDEYGMGFAWFINEPTANTRFTPGNHVYLRIRINDGHDGTAVNHVFTTTDYATVLNFGTESGANQGTAFYAKSEEAPMSFAMLFSNDDDMRPIYSTSIEATGIDYTGINQYADFYQEEVSGKNGYFGGILPNDNADGVFAIWILDLESYVINDYYSEDGLWGVTNTVNPTGGLDQPLFIDLTEWSVEEVASMDVKVWNADQEITVENGEDSRLVMTVYNVLGQPVMHKSIAANSNAHINHSLSEGVYVVTLQHATGMTSTKIVVR
ncbi:MAG: chitobiase/beta-hexosaminidase C-terminal domain-containing protein [Bacteroidales bacterium]|nr:chitobiase/beta-hexosaminidase C-terminal domain-containing protein [Bacteroidales bacterium]